MFFVSIIYTILYSFLSIFIYRAVLLFGYYSIDYAIICAVFSFYFFLAFKPIKIDSLCYSMLGLVGFSYIIGGVIAQFRGFDAYWFVLSHGDLLMQK